MTAVAYYLLKVILCSGILYLHYLLALKNKIFHQWNRFYLLSAVVLSLILPLLQFAVLPHVEEGSNAIRLLKVVESADDYLEEFTVSAQPQFSLEQWVEVGYGAVAAVIFIGLLCTLYRIKSLAIKWGVEKLDRIKFVNTTEPGTPFSFFNYIFWNRNISLQTESGQRIFRHEAVHVAEKHSLDKIFIQLVLILFWCNPFFWLIKRELRFVHEFIADKKSVGANNAAAFAAMILQTIYPQQAWPLTNPFFQTSIKRRIAMLTKTENPRLAYISRLITLPLIAIVAFAFTVRTKPAEKIVNLEKEFVVVIDAGHGYENGKPQGVQIGDLNESDMVLDLANKIKATNTNHNLKFVFTRPGKEIVGLKERVEITKAAGADLFISLHINAAENNIEKGLQIYLPPANASTSPQNNALASAIIAGLGSIYNTASQPLQRKNAVYVLDHSPCPAVLVEFGYLTNEDDRNFLRSEENQQKMVRQLLKAIETYAASPYKDYKPLNKQDTIPQRKKEISSMDVNTIQKTISIQYADGSSENLTMEEGRKRGYLDDKTFTEKKTAPKAKKIAPKPLYVVDGKEVTEENAMKTDPVTIESINILRDAPSINKYGNRGKAGVVEIKLKTKPSNEKITISDNDKPVMSGEIKKLERNGNSVNVEANMEAINSPNQ